ncbi:class I SAM-dependent methyltransferase [Streptomyces daliensis]
MHVLARRLLDALHRFNSAHPWDHNAHYHRWILRQVPRHVEHVLDVGSGAGDLARLLAARATSVRGIDSSPAMVARARELTAQDAPVTFTVADAPTGIPPGPYSVITCVAALHHLPFTDALTHFRRHLAPGGTLVVVGLFRTHSPGDYVLATLAAPLNLAMGLLENRGRAAPRPPAMRAPVKPATMTFPDIAREARRVLPGARLRRRLFWRYTLVWRRDG